MRTLGLDFGTKRIGLAISDSEGEFAFPKGKLDRKGRKQDLAALSELVERNEVERIVIGIPLHMNGREGVGADAARSFASDLGEVTGIHVDTLDERLSTVEAERMLQASGHNARKRKEVVDSVAASIILRTYLDLQRTRETSGENES